jgi:hypothetical protein
MIVVVCLVSLYHDEVGVLEIQELRLTPKIIHWLKPAADWMQR